jgi:uncharacterized protein (DUF1330 family)
LAPLSAGCRRRRAQSRYRERRNKGVTTIAGAAAPQLAVIQQWDSTDALVAWYNGAEYQAALEIGEKYATFRRYAVAGNQ